MFSIAHCVIKMRSCPFGVVFFMLLVAAVAADDNVPFAQNYYVLYGPSNVNFSNENKEVQLSIDQNSGSGFASLKNYSSGSFQIRMKLSKNDTSCIITTFYLRSYSDNHDELDFEFYGGEGVPYELQTNVFANGVGGREQRVSLWFDPTADFHTYQVLWNQHQIAFFVDGTPIRVFKNNTNIGVNYPWQAMRIEATIWEATWSCQQGTTPKWSEAPFRANYQGFGVEGCDLTAAQDCYSSNYPWNDPKYWNLDASQNAAYKDVRSKYLVYDYCTNGNNPECKSNEPN